MQARFLDSLTRVCLSLSTIGGSIVFLAVPACVSSPDSPDPQPETLRYASSDATRFEAGIFEWHLTPDGNGFRVLGLNRDGGVDVEMILRHDEAALEIEMVYPDPGTGRIDIQSGMFVGELPNPELFIALTSDLEPYASDELVPRSHNSWSCYAAAAAAGVACAIATGAPTPPTGAACATALGVAAAACGGPHCDQIQCNAMCTSGGHLYGWCVNDDPWSCGCHGQAGGGGGGGGGCVDDWDCPGWGYCLGGTCS